MSPRSVIVILLGILLCACSLFAADKSFASASTANGSSGTITFAERVAYQKAIEEVYWRHRVWPKENPAPKPSLDAVVSQRAAEKKVRDYLRESQALEDYWQRPITAEQLQAEMYRMASSTKQPEVLKELFEVLGNDPFVIAECLARPLLAERLLSNRYACDQRIHGKAKQRAQAELKMHTGIEQMKQLGGDYSENEFVKSERDEHLRNGANGSTQLSSREWDATEKALATTFNKASDATSHLRTDVAASLSRGGGNPSWGGTAGERRGYNPADAYEIIPIGKLSLLQEDQIRFFVIAVLEKTANHLKLATVTWSKESLESWLTKAESKMREATATGSAAYILPSISAESVACDDTWTSTAIMPTGRARHIAIWTGSEMIVWGGEVALNIFSNTGGRYTPSTDSWAVTSTANAPTNRADLSVVWTGTEMIVWGGDTPGVWFNTGGRYNPSSDSWISTSIANAPHARQNHTAVWTGTEMIVWGGLFYDPPATPHYINTGGRYNPNNDTWTTMSVSNAPDGRDSHTAIWTGNEMIVWGGAIANSQWVNTGGRYDAATDAWTTTSTANAPSARAYHTGIWTGSEMIVWGGFTFSSQTDTGGRYSPSTNSWAATSITNVPKKRYDHAAVWTSDEMIIWGGYGCDLSCSSNYPDTGGRYDPSTNNWVATSMTNSPSRRAGPTAVWTGSEMIVWGGYFSDGSNSNYLNTGGRYCAQPSAPMVQSAVSRKAHGGAGSFDVDLPLSGMPGIECRSGGAANDYTIVVTFLANVSLNASPQATIASGVATIGSGGVSNGGTVVISDNVVTIPLTNVTNAQTINVTLNNVNGSTNVTIPMRVLVGDVNGNGTVNASDVALAKIRVGQTINAANFKGDVNSSGAINAGDVSLVKSMVGSAVP